MDAMNDIYTAIDLGTDSIKIIVANRVNNSKIRFIIILF